MHRSIEAALCIIEVVYPCGVATSRRVEDVAVGVGERDAEVAHSARRLLLETGKSSSQFGVGGVACEAERRRLRLTELDDGEARQRRQHVEPVSEHDEELRDGRPLGRRERAVDDDDDVQCRVEPVEHAACMSSSSTLSASTWQLSHSEYTSPQTLQQQQWRI